jgi:hypothetical protein
MITLGGVAGSGRRPRSFIASTGVSRVTQHVTSG